MFLKFLVVILFLANLVALGSALFALLNDEGREEGKRTAKFLLIRVSLAAALLVVILYGFYTGELGVGVPWYDASRQ
ncbi:MAG: DUF2909 domain-containing protein [Pseudomonadales bacterium]|jgi:hypothetical protein|nr:DUF2909 domain-containing protein [Pseudomonadales bacterium]